MAGPVLRVSLDDIRSWVKKREAALIDAEDDMFRAARDRATTDEERAYWEDFIALRSRNREQAGRRQG